MNIKDEIEGVARHLRIVCSQQIEDLEDQLPQVTNPAERKDLQKQIDTLHEMTDEVNRRAEVLIVKYENDSKS
jgi:predicted  nucleic acid-binding Zn-ribbon protein